MYLGRESVGNSLVSWSTQASEQIEVVCTRSPIGRGKRLKTAGIQVRVLSGVLRSVIAPIGKSAALQKRMLGVRVPLAL